MLHHATCSVCLGHSSVHTQTQWGVWGLTLQVSHAGPYDVGESATFLRSKLFMLYFDISWSVWSLSTVYSKTHYQGLKRSTQISSFFVISLYFQSYSTLCGISRKRTFGFGDYLEHIFTCPVAFSVTNPKVSNFQIKIHVFTNL